MNTKTDKYKQQEQQKNSLQKKTLISSIQKRFLMHSNEIAQGERGKKSIILILLFWHYCLRLFGDQKQNAIFQHKF